MSNWLSWQELLDLLKIKGFEALEYLGKGLQPYSKPDLQPLDCPDFCHIYRVEFPEWKRIVKFLSALNNAIDFLKNKMHGKSIIRLESTNKVVDDLFHYVGHVFNPTKSVDGNHVHISLWDIRELEAEKKWLEETELTIRKELEPIAHEDPDCRSWKYFVKPSSAEDIEKLISEVCEKAIYRRDDVSEVQRKFGLGEIDEVEKEISEGDYIFRQEGPSWTITYEGKTLRALKGNGFEIIHYLVRHKRKMFHTGELSQEFDKTVPTEGQKQHVPYSPQNEYALSNKDKEFVDAGARIYGKSMEELKKHRYYLYEKLRKAEENADPIQLAKANEELKGFNRYCTYYFGPRGRARNDIDNPIRTKNRITKRIGRALNRIKEHDEDTYLHLKRSLGPINSFFQAYNPDRSLDWHTE
jgi:hypothetical protein